MEQMSMRRGKRRKTVHYSSQVTMPPL